MRVKTVVEDAAAAEDNHSSVLNWVKLDHHSSKQSLTKLYLCLCDG